VRKLAYITNTIVFIALLVLFFVILNDPREDKVTSLLPLLFLTFPLINFFALAGSGKEKDFFSLYFERKRLEQQKKINELKKSIDE